MQRIAIFNFNATRRDPRVRRISAALRSAGHELCVFELAGPGMPTEEELPGGVQVRRAPLPKPYDAAAWRALMDEAPDFAALLGQCDPAMIEVDYPARTMALAASAGRRLRQALRRILPSLPQAPLESRQPLGFLIAPMRTIMVANLALWHRAQEFRPTLAWSNDLDTLPAGWLLKQRLGIPLVYDAHEVYPEQLPDHMRTDRWHRFYTRLEEMLAPQSDGRLTVCDAIGHYFEQRYGAPGFVTLRNVPSLRLQPPREQVFAPRTGRRQLVYHGVYAPYRGLEEIIAAARLLKGADIVFRGIGAHEGPLRALVDKGGLQDRITFSPPVAVDDLVASASACDIGLNPFVDVCLNTRFALPNKFFEYMMAGLALASSDLVEMRRLTSELGVGVLFPSLAPEAIAEVLDGLLSRPAELNAMRERAWTAARTRFNWETEQERLLDLVRRFG
jgi:glycogen(starch) synthase